MPHFPGWFVAICILLPIANAIYRAVKERKYGLTINDLPHGRGYFKKQKNVHTITKEISEKKKEISIEVMPKEIKNKERGES